MRTCLRCRIETVDPHNDVSDCLEALCNEIPRLEKKLAQLKAVQQTLAPDVCPYCLGKRKEPASGVMVRCRFCGGTGKRG